MFKFKVYKNGRIYDEQTEKTAVLSLLARETVRPGHIQYNKKTVNIVFSDSKFTEVYTIPVEYWKGGNAK